MNSQVCVAVDGSWAPAPPDHRPPRVEPSFSTFGAQRLGFLGGGSSGESQAISFTLDAKVAANVRHGFRESRDNYRCSEIKSLVLQNDELRLRHLGRREMPSDATGIARGTIRQRVVEENRLSDQHQEHGSFGLQGSLDEDDSGEPRQSRIISSFHGQKPDEDVLRFNSSKLNADLEEYSDGDDSFLIPPRSVLSSDEDYMTRPKQHHGTAATSVDYQLKHDRRSTGQFRSMTSDDNVWKHEKRSSSSLSSDSNDGSSMTSSMCSKQHQRSSIDQGQSQNIGEENCQFSIDKYLIGFGEHVPPDQSRTGTYKSQNSNDSDPTFSSDDDVYLTAEEDHMDKTRNVSCHDSPRKKPRLGVSVISKPAKSLANSSATRVTETDKI